MRNRIGVTLGVVLAVIVLMLVYVTRESPRSLTATVEAPEASGQPASYRAEAPSPAGSAPVGGRASPAVRQAVPSIEAPRIAPVPRGDSALWRDRVIALAMERSIVSEEATTPPVENTCPVDVELFWVDYEGRERSYGTLEAGVAMSLSTYRGHVWRARSLDGVEVKSFMASSERIELCDNDHFTGANAPVVAERSHSHDEHASQRSIEPAHFTIDNTCGAGVSLYWVHFDGTERPWGTIDAGAARSQDTFHGHVWHVRDPNGELLTSFVAEGTQHIASCGLERS